MSLPHRAGTARPPVDTSTEMALLQPPAVRTRLGRVLTSSNLQVAFTRTMVPGRSARLS